MYRRLAMMFLLTLVQPAVADLCAQPGRDGVAEVQGEINLYFPAPQGESLAAGQREIPVGNPRGEGSLEAGDLVLLVQMQGADIASGNDSDYGAADGSGRGWTVLQAGRHEMLRVEEVIPEHVRIRGTGPDRGLAHDYPWFRPRGADDPGARRWQLVRVPQFERLSLTGDLRALEWDGRTGGVLALDVRRTLALRGHGLDAGETGFRGGAPMNLTGALGQVGDYRYPSPDARERAAGYGQHASKGEGVAGTPRWVAEGEEVYQAAGVQHGASDGYPGGAMARGAPANAGGGGNSLDLDNTRVSGGGGGGGGRNGADGRDAQGQPRGGRGGAGLSARRIALTAGGGGGAGSRPEGQDLSGGGGRGGGVVHLRAGRLDGPGFISVSGAAGREGSYAGGGGGGGGTALLLAAFGTLDGIALDLDGGDGGAGPAPGGGGGAGRLLVGGGIDRDSLPEEASVNGQLRPARLVGVAGGYQCSPSGTLISGRIARTRYPLREEAESEGLAGLSVRVLGEDGEALAETQTGSAGQFALELPEALAGQMLELHSEMPEGQHPVRVARGFPPEEEMAYTGDGRWQLRAREQVHYEGLELLLMPEPELEAPEAREVSPGNTEIFLFRYLPGAEARVRFGYSSREDEGWEHTFFLDPECDGASQYVDRDRTRWVDAEPEQPVCLRVRVRVPEQERLPGQVLDMRVRAETDPGETMLAVELPELEGRLEVSPAP